jgi:hypothetical protein
MMTGSPHATEPHNAQFHPISAQVSRARACVCAGAGVNVSHLNHAVRELSSKRLTTVTCSESKLPGCFLRAHVLSEASSASKVAIITTSRASAVRARIVGDKCGGKLPYVDTAVAVHVN